MTTATSEAYMLPVENMVGVFLHNPEHTLLMAIPVRVVAVNAFGPPSARGMTPMVQTSNLCMEPCNTFGNFVALQSVADIGVSIGTIPTEKVPAWLVTKAAITLARLKAARGVRRLTPSLQVVCD